MMQFAIKYYLVSAILLLSFTVSSYGQDKTAMNYMSQLDSTQIKETLTKLASDEFEGRGTGEKGGDMTTNYLAEYLKKINVSPGNNGSYFQNIGALVRDKGQKRFELNDYNYQDDYSYENISKNDSIIGADKILFVGYGVYSSTYNDYENMNITDKVIMMIDDVPSNKFGLDYFINPLTENYLKQKHPKAIIKVKPGFRSYSHSTSRWVMFPQDERGAYIPTIYVNERLANKILEPTNKTIKQINYEVEKSGKSPSTEINSSFVFAGDYSFEDAKANNVIAYIEGRDLKDEYIVLMAHHDHDGMRYGNIYNGADDNASGVSGVLEITRMLAKAKKEGKNPRRSIIVLLPTAEEKGLIGSKHYVNNPIFSLEKTVACVNLDMIGRINGAYESKGNDYVFVVSHKTMSGNLPQVLEQVNNNSLNLTTDYKYTSPGDSESHFSRSDQYSFAEKNIPAIMFTSGEHKDYHRTSDDTEFIDFDGLLKRTKLAFLLVWELANAN